MRLSHRPFFVLCVFVLCAALPACETLQDIIAVPSAGSGGAGGAAPEVPGWTGRPPAVPLLVRSPSVSTWQTADELAARWPVYWSDRTRAMTGVAVVDGAKYLFLGAPREFNAVSATQLDRAMTPTRSSFTFAAGTITLFVDFVSPVEPSDLRRQSVPFGYVVARAQSRDSTAHRVQLYFDISGEWAHGDDTTPIRWSREQVPHAGGSLTAFSITPAAPEVLVEKNGFPSWGTTVWATAATAAVTTQAGADVVVRATGARQGRLDNTVAADMPRSINDRWPVFAFMADLDPVGAAMSEPITLVVGHVREPAGSYLGEPIAPLWRSFWSSWQEMLADTFDDAGAALARAGALDARIIADATAVAGPEYAALCDLSLRQAFGGTELVGVEDRPWLFLKDISGRGDVSSIDTLYAASPAFLYVNPRFLRLLLDPIFAYVERGSWTWPFAPLGLGGPFPRGDGDTANSGGLHAVVASADMLLMTAAYVRAAKADGSVYAAAHLDILTQWATYLKENTPLPADALAQFTDDGFPGLLNGSTNLELKAVLALGAMAQLTEAAGHAADAATYRALAEDLIGQWATLAKDPSGEHLRALRDKDGTWSLQYDAFYDQLLGLGLIPSAVLSREMAWYAQNAQPFGVHLFSPEEPRRTARVNWEMWIAAASPDAALRESLIHDVYSYATTTSQRVPFADGYDPTGGERLGFQARPVIGGVFAPLLGQGRSLLP